jgi:hypothetical protein
LKKSEQVLVNDLCDIEQFASILSKCHKKAFQDQIKSMILAALSSPLLFYLNDDTDMLFLLVKMKNFLIMSFVLYMLAFGFFIKRNEKNHLARTLNALETNFIKPHKENKKKKL